MLAIHKSQESTYDRHVLYIGNNELPGGSFVTLTLFEEFENFPFSIFKDLKKLDQELILRPDVMI